MDFLKPGVVYGEDLYRLLKYAQEKGFAIPSVNCTTSSTVNAALEAARDAKSPIMIQFSNGGSVFYAGKGMGNSGEKAAIAGAIAGAYHVKALAKLYGVPVIIHSDHCAKKLLPWFDGMLEEDEKHFAEHGVPLFSSHMIDLSEEPLKENIEICEKYLKRMVKVNLMLEMELGITGGEEDGKFRNTWRSNVVHHVVYMTIAHLFFSNLLTSYSLSDNLVMCYTRIPFYFFL
jgi:fructose-bisphosphate aldolase, class II